MTGKTKADKRALAEAASTLKAMDLEGYLKAIVKKAVKAIEEAEAVIANSCRGDVKGYGYVILPYVLMKNRNMQRNRSRKSI